MEGTLIVTIQQLLAAKSGIACDPIDFCSQLLVLGLQRIPVIFVIGTISRLLSQGTHPLQHGCHFIHGPFGGLSDGDTVVGVAVALIQAIDLGSQAVGDLQACRIVLGAVDTQTGCQTGIRAIQRFVGVHQVTLGVQ
ncbi:hypothetical protein D3C77_597670 [compost metagenome]